ncbi:hypothetical protein C8P63_103136 [Melghirimyces profundicolus]|uniref:TIGR01777 family protein n=1 Tax=Melghirimyces profundicolus TaxID=1242148 RepID=A0A2T6C7P9_9BACL|nr:TIGR01777 family oxidoreductase [Melghirimyces profundicolus]PTX64351.1 hypothetical protein C8P63_103136 [Melghirimyces profundicolus]
MRIAMTGSSGLIGSTLVRHLTGTGHEVTRVVRSHTDRKKKGFEIRWSPDRGEIDAAGLEGHEAVIHLAGENIASGRWTRKKKEQILKSRQEGTQLLARTLAGLKHPPKVLLSASAVGYYGNRPPGIKVDEGTPAGNGFLARVSMEWERATRAAVDAGIRVAHMRFGMVLSRKGGALATMLPLFKLGLGGRIGRGRQMMSWIARDEIPHVVDFLLEREDLSGPVNIVAPAPVNNEEFTRTLGRILRRPTPFPLPGPIARVVLGEMAEELLLGGNQTLPKKLLESECRFRWPHLEKALRHELNKEDGHR